MEKKVKTVKFPSELRMDLVSKDWVVIATGRARRPETFKKERRKEEIISRKDCPFCGIEKQETPVLIFSNGERICFNPGEKITSRWTTLVIPNKYPAFSPSSRLNKRVEDSLYQTMNAAGYHEVVITRDHKKQLAQMGIPQIKEVLDVYQQRYVSLMEKPLVRYVSIFHNHGVEAGASVAHPHSQIVTIPLIDTDLRSALLNSKRYFRRHNKCVSCSMNEWEKESKKRIIFENKNFLALCPFASKAAFQVIISPKKHLSYFECATEEEKKDLAEAFQVVLKKLYKGLSDPAYNFYLHTAPCDGKDYSHYHWHWTILPKTSIWAGFEIGTRMEISTIEPEKAAEYLRKQ